MTPRLSGLGRSLNILLFDNKRNIKITQAQNISFEVLHRAQGYDRYGSRAGYWRRQKLAMWLSLRSCQLDPLPFEAYYFGFWMEVRQCLVQSECMSGESTEAEKT
jgi:hypothetical protein